MLGLDIDVLLFRLGTRSSLDMLSWRRAGINGIDARGVGGAFDVSVDPESDRSDAVGVSVADGGALCGLVGVRGFLRDERGGGGGSMVAEAELRLRRRRGAPAPSPASSRGRLRMCGDGAARTGRRCGVRETCRPMAICSIVGGVSGAS